MLKRLMLLLITVLTGLTACTMTAPMNLTGGVKMISGKSLKMCAVQKKKLVRDGVLPHFWQIQQDYATLLSTYTIYDIPAKGGLSYLDAETGYQLCVWKTCAPAYLDTPVSVQATSGSSTTVLHLDSGGSAVVDYYKGMIFLGTSGANNGVRNICTGYDESTKYATFTKAWSGGAPSSGDDFTVGGYDKIETTDTPAGMKAVIVTGLKVNAYNQIESAYNTVKFGFATNNGNFVKLSLYYITWYDYTQYTIPSLYSYIENWKAYYSTLYISTYYVDETPDEPIHRNTTFENCRLMLFGNPLKTLLEITTGITWKNIQGLDDYNIEFEITNATLTLNNVRDLSIHLKEISGTAIANMTNVLLPLYSSFSALGVRGVNGYNIILGNPNNFSDSIENYIISPLENYTQINSVLYNTIDLSIIDWSTDFALQAADISARYIPDTSYYGGGTRLYYTLKFINSDVTDALKSAFSKGWYLMVQREDYEYSLVTTQKYIKNMTFYNEVGCTTELDFTADENILILAEDSSGNDVVFVLWDSVLYSSYLTDVYPNTVYTITHCFQLWEKSNIADGLRNMFTDATTKQAITNSPMEGSVEFNNVDNEWAIR